MCGIAGFWQQGGGAPSLEGTVRRMTDAIRHRGPDADGHWTDSELGVALGHRRLSILDLSPAGAQPMISASGRYVITFNGEIYNWQALRSEEERHGATWRGHSDTEVLLAATERLGIVETLRRAAGMFAFALWDREKRTLTLARDRMGEKPLYWGWVGRTLLFGSELKAIRAFAGWQGEIDRDAVALFLRHSCIPAPRSIYRNIQKVMPGTVVTVRADGTSQTEGYWSLAGAAAAGEQEPLSGDVDQGADALDPLLRQVIGEQMVADVPLGAFLSGGIDSSLIVALMQAQSPRPVRTFTIGFEDPAYNEADHARGIARHLGTEHTELMVTPADALALVPRLPTIYDEPFADSSQLPTCLVAMLTRRAVTVSLSGDGGDELFGGYSRYPIGARMERRVRAVPRPVRALVAAGLSAVPSSGWDRLLGSVPMPNGIPGGIHGDRVAKLAELLRASGPELRFRPYVSHWRDPEALVPGSVLPPTVFDRPSPVSGQLARMMYLDAAQYLPDDILVKVDRAAMAVGLESRAPLLDHRVAEFAWRAPDPWRQAAGRGKVILRRLLGRYIPPALWERPKMGFGVPVAAWLRGPLKEWADDLLSVDRLRREGIFDPAPIGVRWQEHRSGRRDWGYLLWDVLMFQAWQGAQ